MALWGITLVLPLTFAINPFAPWGIGLQQLTSHNNWAMLVFVSLTANIAVFALLS